MTPSVLGQVVDQGDGHRVSITTSIDVQLSIMRFAVTVSCMSLGVVTCWR